MRTRAQRKRALVSSTRDNAASAAAAEEEATDPGKSLIAFGRRARRRSQTSGRGHAGTKRERPVPEKEVEEKEVAVETKSEKTVGKGRSGRRRMAMRKLTVISEEENDEDVRVPDAKRRKSSETAEKTPVTPEREFGAIPATPVLRRSGASELISLVRRLKRENGELRRVAGPKGEDTVAQLRSLQASYAEASAALAHARVEAAQAAQAARAARNAGDLESKVQTLEAAKQGLEKDKKVLEATTQKLETEKDRLMKEKDALEERVRVLEAQIAELEGRLQDQDKMEQEYMTRLSEVDFERAALQEKVLNLEGRIRVLVRARPNKGASMVRYPREAGGDCISVEIGQPGNRKSVESKITVHKVFPPSSSQVDVFHSVRGVVASATDGKRACIFAYGQTGAGKTHTVFGSPPDSQGIAPRTANVLFQRKQDLEARGFQVNITAEFLEIYNDKVYDLLPSTSTGCMEESETSKISFSAASHSQKSSLSFSAASHSQKSSLSISAASHSKKQSSSSSSKKHSSLDVRSNPMEGTVEVVGSCVHAVSSEMELVELIQLAGSKRSTSKTASNATSSRSHAVVSICFSAVHPKEEEEVNGHLHLVDLAGSERLNRSGSGSDPKLLKEAQHINKSLTSLGLVLRALGMPNPPHVPFRDSKLTFILQPSLTNGARALMLVNINPEEESRSETLSSLRFAQHVASSSTTN